MKTAKYSDRLPQLRVSPELLAKLFDRARSQDITLAEAHRQVLNQALMGKGILIPIVGTVNAKTGEIALYDEKPLEEAA